MSHCKEDHARGVHAAFTCCVHTACTPTPRARRVHPPNSAFCFILDTRRTREHPPKIAKTLKKFEGTRRARGVHADTRGVHANTRRRMRQPRRVPADNRAAVDVCGFCVHRHGYRRAPPRLPRARGVCRRARRVRRRLWAVHHF